MQHAGCVVCLVLVLAGVLFFRMQPLVCYLQSACQQHTVVVSSSKCIRQLVGCFMQVSSGVASARQGLVAAAHNAGCGTWQLLT
jgi:hypothetical protein